MLELAKIAFPEVKRLAESARALTILPVGVVEEHGVHLPLGLDSFAAEVYAASAAPHLEDKGYEVVVAPTICYGVARAAIDFPGTLSLEPETLRAMVVETVPGYLTLMRGALYVRTRSMTSISTDLLFNGEVHWPGYDPVVWRKLWETAKGLHFPSTSQLAELIRTYLEQARLLVQFIDGIAEES